jgi:hypothetical protein
VKPVRTSANGHAQPAVLPGRDQTLRRREGIGERDQRAGVWVMTGHYPGVVAGR